MGSPQKAATSMRFFKTGKGQYGAGDVFIGISVPEQRKVALKYQNLAPSDLESLLYSKEHEFRLVALMILVGQYQKGDKAIHKKLTEFYLAHAKRVNNWDLVDASAHYILGDYLLRYKTEKQALALLIRLAKSDNLWERRITMVATWAFIRAKNPAPTFTLAQVLIQDKEDLMHKAVGWMLREVGKHCGQRTLSSFLDKYADQLPRTSLRYALEHYNEVKRKHYMMLKK